MLRRSVLLVTGAIVCTTMSAFAQNTEGRWMVGVRGGANMWFNDLNKRIISSSAGGTVRYGLSKRFSLGFETGVDILKALQDPPLPQHPGYLRTTFIPALAIGTLHLTPGKRVSAHFNIGAGVGFYRVQDGTDAFLPNNAWQTSIAIPVGFQVDLAISKRVSLTGEMRYTLASNETDTVLYKAPDSYASARLGVGMYLGSGKTDDDDGDKLSNGDEELLGTNPEIPDSDGDGLRDGEEVKKHRSSPLSADSDKDGLSDGDEALTYRSNPASVDTDGDGLPDGDEILKHNTDPLKIDTDVDGLPDGDEVLKHGTDPWRSDSDADGLSDWDELNIRKTSPARPDTDGDGLTDGEELSKYRSNPLKEDSDGGGVNDGVEASRGTNPLTRSDDALADRMKLEPGKSVVMEDVTFESGSAELTLASERTLEKAAAALLFDATLRVEIIGHTDASGNAMANMALSQRRAESVRAWFIKRGIASVRMTPVGKGSSEPATSNETPEGRAINRRIELRASGPQP